MINTKLLKNRKITLTVFLWLILFLSITPVLAEDKYGLDATAANAGLTAKELPTMIGLLISYILQFIGVLLFLLLLYGGFLWMTSAGSEDKIKKAKGIITNAVIGIVLVLAAYAITSFILTKITSAASGTSNKL